ncbi:hypothetical protein BH23PLA1_BH23PLA1_43940 [soil metagenome]
MGSVRRKAKVVVEGIEDLLILVGTPSRSTNLLSQGPETGDSREVTPMCLGMRCVDDDRRFGVAAMLMALLIMAPASSSADDEAKAPRRPNVVFILADDLGWTDMGCYGSKYYQTPNIDRLAAQGMRFTDGYTCGPNCQPTRAALLSGQYGPRTGIYTVGSRDRFDWRSQALEPPENGNELAP